MRAYRAGWTLAVVTVGGLAAAVEWLVLTTWLLLLEAATVATVGAAFGATWEEDPDRRWATGWRWARRGLVLSVLLTGLPPVMGAWALLVIVSVSVTHPALVQALVRRLNRRRRTCVGDRLEELSDEQLSRQWRASTLAVRSSWRTPGEVLELVQERVRLLDELERRDPEGFSQWLAGGRQAQELEP